VTNRNRSTLRYQGCAVSDRGRGGRHWGVNQGGTAKEILFRPWTKGVFYFPAEKGGITMERQVRYCFIGAGSMAEAMISGLLKKGMAEPKQIMVINRQNRARLANLNREYGVQIPENKGDAVL
jgi:hypothetical protein